jgi:branched-chain amino acid transport system permease protein
VTRLRSLTRSWTLLALIAGVAAAVLLILWRPTVLVYGIQKAGLYAAIALPMALILGIVGIINLSHGEFMMVGAYLAYWISVSMGADPLLTMIPVVVAMAGIGILTFLVVIRPVLGAPELNQLILTFGLAMVLSQLANLLWTSQPRKLSVSYASASATVGAVSFGTFDFLYTGAAILILVGLLLFLHRTRAGRVAIAVGQNPRGARLVGINVRRTYLVIFSISIALVGVMGALFVTRSSIFPLVGGSFTMKSFCLIAMAGVGNLAGILWCSLGLGLAESLILSFRGYSGWADIVFFALIIIVIVMRSYRRRLA